MRRLRSVDERGAAAVIVLASMLTLFGMAGYVIDVGIVRQERRELQNGADAAALDLAQECALGRCTDLNSKAKTYADANARDGHALASAALINANSVKVDTHTETGTGATSLTMQFAQHFGHRTSTVGATATARWGAPGSASTIPLTISYCEWNSLTGAGATFPTAEATVYFHDPTSNGKPNSAACSGGPAGQDLPGGFGVLKVPSNNCSVAISAGGLYSTRPGNADPSSEGCECSGAGNDFPLNTDLLIPVYQAFGGSGANGQYRIYGFATFRMSRMRLKNGAGSNCWLTSPAPPNCSSSQRCIYGSFTRDIIPWTGSPAGPPGPSLGTFAVGLSA